MANPIPNNLALSVIANGQTGDATPVENNFSEIQSAVNALIAALSGGTVGQQLQAVDTSDVQWANRPSAPTRQVFSVAGSGTYVTPANCKAILVECIGGGGGAGGTAATGVNQCAASGSGGGGAYASKLITNPSATYPYTVGAAGVGAGGGPGTGGVGGDTTFGPGPLMDAGGGGGGIGGPADASFVGGAGGGAGQAIAGDILIPGSPGCMPFKTSAVALIQGANGGAAARGGGGGRCSAIAVGNTNGNPGSSPGGGGSGGYAFASAATTTGGNGAPGMIVVTEYY